MIVRFLLLSLLRQCDLKVACSLQLVLLCRGGREEFYNCVLV